MESIDWYTGSLDITEITLKTELTHFQTTMDWFKLKQIAEDILECT